MAKKYFKKEQLRSPVFGPDNKPIQFTPVFGGDGVIELDEEKDAAMIDALNKYAEARKGGVVRVSAEVVESLKKNIPSTGSRNRSFLNQIRVMPSIDQIVPSSVSASDAPPAAGSVTVIDEPAPPSSIRQFKARTRKISAAPPLPPTQ